MKWGRRPRMETSVLDGAVTCTGSISLVGYNSDSEIFLILYCITKSVLGRVRNLCMLVLRLCSVMVASLHIVDTRQVYDLVKTMWSTVYD